MGFTFKGLKFGAIKVEVPLIWFGPFDFPGKPEIFWKFRAKNYRFFGEVHRLMGVGKKFRN